MDASRCLPVAASQGWVRLDNEGSPIDAPEQYAVGHVAESARLLALEWSPLREATF